jgi:hypothetical protein
VLWQRCSKNTAQRNFGTTHGGRVDSPPEDMMQCTSRSNTVLVDDRHSEHLVFLIATRLTSMGSTTHKIEFTAMEGDMEDGRSAEGLPKTWHCSSVNLVVPTAPGASDTGISPDSNRFRRAAVANLDHPCARAR